MSDEGPPRLDGGERTVMHRLGEVRELTGEELDALPFGVVRLAGKNPGDVIGKNFFTDVVPLHQRRGVRGEVSRGRSERQNPRDLPVTVHVMVTIHHEKPEERAWVFVDGSR